MVECNKIRKRILDLAFNAKSAGSHLGGSLSAVEILYSLYDFANVCPHNGDRDRIILSKGHAALALYSVLEDKGLLSTAEVDEFEHNGTLFFAHAKRNILKGIEFSGGSLSLGVSYAVGVALACKSKGFQNHVYVILGDGECNEGLVWEAVMSAAHYKLGNITFIVDRNGLQSDGNVSDVMCTSILSEKFKSFGCDVIDVDGHNYYELIKAYGSNSEDKPISIIAHTIKGKGVSFMEGQQQWHHNTLSEQQYKQALCEIGYGEI